MVPQPVVLGLLICDHVIIEEGTRKTTLVGTFESIRAGGFPTQT